MAGVVSKDGTKIFYKDWRSSRPIMFHHGWPLSADDWDAQMLYFLHRGYRVIAHDRRGHGRSAQVGSGHDRDHYAAGVDAVVEHFDLRDTIHIGHSTGGGEALLYAATHGKGRVTKLVMIGAVPPIMVKTPGGSGGLPMALFDGFRQSLAPKSAKGRSVTGGARA